ncbi:DsbA family protein [Rhizobium sp. BK418]|uniref:DsbA family oxidoreductase n=1 Tax=Rhizobium sp. BK418 TaxID=2512120 RepID=UPI00104811F0|nr:DsbA family protein [Rhizobium sp. BK418]TCR94777.1 putative DsbA family dithiol-disulfide isomerase [Rhizobium sp. BK418]
MTGTSVSVGDIRSAAPARLIEMAGINSIVLHWYDLTCPFCYLGQARTNLLQDRGMTVVELPFQAHPDIPKEGVHIGERIGLMYERIESDAKTLGMPLHWPPRLPNSRVALSAAEWVRRNKISSFASVQERLFRAHFADGLDIGDPGIVLQCISEVVDDVDRLRQSLLSGEAGAWLTESERMGHQIGVTATPTWIIAGRAIRGFVAQDDFEALVRIAKGGQDPSSLQGEVNNA